MRIVVVAIFVCAASCAWADDTVVIQPYVHLYTAQDLETLRATNPDHYARATRLLASASQLCQTGEPKLQNTDARDISCGLRLLTSNPPKRVLSFMLDRTRYVALVTMTADQPKFVSAR